MARAHLNLRFCSAIALAVLAAGCTLKKQETPSLTGPSELGTAITLSVSPDVLTEDGASQSLVSITARDSHGQPLRNVSLRADIQSGGVTTDALGTLSARNLVTDANGRASLIFTAPRTPDTHPGAGDSALSPIQVQIAVTPSETDFANSTTRFAMIQLVPQGTVGLPAGSLLVDFQPKTATLGDATVFTATVKDALGADATSQVTSYSWTFGDDSSTATGRAATHVFTRQDLLQVPVTLTVVDTSGRISTATFPVQVAAGANPVAQFVSSPTAVVVNQAVNFNATLSAATPGHKITDFSWNFGDGALGNGALVNHTYTVAGSYIVVLKITDDVGRKATATQTITVTTDVPLAKFTFTPSAPAATAGNSASVVFDANQSLAVNGRTIVTFAWDFGDGSTATGPTVSHSFLAGSTHVVVLKITDSAGQTATTSQSVTVGVQ
jgi:PKD repeat protein